MGFLDLFRQRTPSWRDAQMTHLTPRITYVGGAWADEVGLAAALDVRDMTAAQLWATQPHLRTVVSFLARNTAQLGLHIYTRVGETDRQRDRTSPAAKALARPNSYMTSFDLLYALVVDLSLYDRAYWARSGNGDGTWSLHRLPPAWVDEIKESAFTTGAYRVAVDGSTVTFKPEDVIRFGGYNPSDPRKGSPTLDALQDVLQEQIESSRFRVKTWKRGGKVSAIITRPAGAAIWSDEARRQFREDWNSAYTGEGSRVGGTPILGDGMDLKKVDFAAKDQQWAEGVRLSLNIVAAAFHVNPTMVGALESTNYSNVREFRKMLYGETLGPLMAQIEAVINSFGLPRLGADESSYAEFNIAEKLQGSFEEQASALQTAIGGPWMTRSEGRARMNLPAMAEADELIVPLNVITGGQASPTDSGSQNQNALPARQSKARTVARPEARRRDVETILSDTLDRQLRAVRSALGAKAATDWWDAERWDRELGDDLLAASLLTSTAAASAVLAGASLDPGTYDVERTRSYLGTATARQAKAINARTQAHIQAAIERAGADGIDPLDAIAEDVDPDSEETGAALLAVAASLVGDWSGFGSVEAGRQGGGKGKTWIVTSGNPRSSHAALDGVTVRLDEDFGNGLPWPGAGGDPDEVANCRCQLDISF